MGLARIFKTVGDRQVRIHRRRERNFAGPSRHFINPLRVIELEAKRRPAMRGFNLINTRRQVLQTIGLVWA